MKGFFGGSEFGKPLTGNPDGSVGLGGLFSSFNLPEFGPPGDPADSGHPFLGQGESGSSAGSPGSLFQDVDSGGFGMDGTTAQPTGSDPLVPQTANPLRFSGDPSLSLYNIRKLTEDEDDYLGSDLSKFTKSLF